MPATDVTSAGVANSTTPSPKQAEAVHRGTTRPHACEPFGDHRPAVATGQNQATEEIERRREPDVEPDEEREPRDVGQQRPRGGVRQHIVRHAEQEEDRGEDDQRADGGDPEAQPGLSVRGARREIARDGRQEVG